MAKIAFVCRDSHFRYGVAMIIAMAKQHNHVCDLFIYEEEQTAFFDNIAAFKPDVVAFACTSGEHTWLLGIAQQLKFQLNCLILVGGPHPTFFPELIENDQIDMICIGEGEFATLELLDALDKGQDYYTIENLWVKQNGKLMKNPIRPLIEDLDSLPFVDRDCYDKYPSIKNDSSIHVLTERGCPYNCSFCFNHLIKKLYKGKGTFCRQVSPKKIIEEIKSLVQRYPEANVVRFSDDLFIHDTKRLFELLSLYKHEIKIPFICHVRANLLTEEVVEKLKDGGCDRVCIGVETGNEELREKILKKKITNEELLKAAAYCHKHKLRLSSLNMIGLPNETIENAIETAVINHKMKVETVIIGVFQPYPRTEIAEYAKEIGLLDEDYSVDELTPSLYDNSVLRQKNIKELVNLLYFFWFVVKYPFVGPFLRLIIKLPRTRFHYLFFNWPLLIRKTKYANYSLPKKIWLFSARIFKSLVFNDHGLESNDI